MNEFGIPNYYKLLKVNPNASGQEISKKYQRLKFLKDLKFFDFRRFFEIREAYKVLSNQKTREEYDQLLKTYYGFRKRHGLYVFWTGFAVAVVVGAGLLLLKLV